MGRNRALHTHDSEQTAGSQQKPFVPGRDHEIVQREGRTGHSKLNVKAVHQLQKIYNNNIIYSIELVSFYLKLETNLLTAGLGRSQNACERTN